MVVIQKEVTSLIKRKFNVFAWYQQKPLFSVEDWDNDVIEFIAEKNSKKSNLTKSMQVFSNHSKTVAVVYYPIAQRVFICYSIAGFAKSKEFKTIGKLVNVSFEVNKVYIDDDLGNTILEVLE